jgi:hypothetical protein
LQQRLYWKENLGGELLPRFAAETRKKQNKTLGYRVLFKKWYLGNSCNSCFPGLSAAIDISVITASVLIDPPLPSTGKCSF